MPRSGETWNPARLARRPELEPFEHLFAPLATMAEFPGPDFLTEMVERARRDRSTSLEPLKFVASAPRPRRQKRGSPSFSELYDGRIAQGGEVPCYVQSYHDLFNALMFAAFPQAKRALHARQYRALGSWIAPGADRLPGRRTREQDALTLFDEGGSVVLCPTHLQTEFARGARLPLARPGADSSIVVFGHALVEHLTEGQTGLRSSARVLFVSELPRGPRLLALVDDFVLRLLVDPLRFATPDADAVVFFERDEVTFRQFDPDNRISRPGAQSAPRSSEQ